MANNVNRQVNIYIQSGEAEKAYNRLIKKQEEYEAALKRATDPKDIKRLQNELKKLEEPLDRAAKKMRGELAASSRDLKNTLAVLNKEIANTSIGTEKWRQLALQIKNANLQLKEMKRMADTIDEDNKKQNPLARGFSKLNDASNKMLGVDLATAGGIFAGGAFLKTAIDEALEGEANLSRFKATLDNLGKSDSFDRINKQAEDLQAKLKYFGTDDLYVVFDQLLNYGKLTEREIERLTPVIIDFAAKQRISFEEATGEIIKGLDGNSKALKKYGIDMKDAGTTTERLAIIMDTLGSKVAGAAESFGKTTDGRIKSTKEQFNDLAGSIGDRLLPAINGVLQGFEWIMLGAKEAISKLGDLWNYFFDNAKYQADQLEKQLQKIRTLADARGKRLFEDFYSDKATKALEKDLKRQEVALDNAKKLYDKAVKDKDDFYTEYYADRVAEEQALTDSIKMELDQRKIQAERDRKDKEDKNKKHIDNLYAQFKKQLDEQVRELDLYNSEQLIKDLDANERKYEKQQESLLAALKKQQLTIAQFEQLNLLNEDSRARERNLILEKWGAEAARRRYEEEKKNSEKLKALDAKRMEALVRQQEQVAKYIAEAADRQLGKLRYSQEVDVFVATGKARLKARIAQLERERQEAIRSAEKENKSILDINREYDKKVSDEKIAFFKDRLGTVLDYVAQIGNALVQLGQLQSEREEKQLENDRRANEAKKESYRKQLEAKQISQKEYDKKVRDLDRLQEQREKQLRLRQFNREKIGALAQAAINIAVNITKALGNPFQVALVATLGAIQMGIIAGQKPPQYGKGGRLRGPLHSQGGMPVVNPRTGKKEAEVEGGEVILSRSTVRNNADIVDRLLYNSLHRNGARLQRSEFRMPAFNTQGIYSSQQRVRMFENGGVMGAPADSTDEDKDTVLITLTSAVQDLNYQLAAGITAYTNLSDHEKAVDRKQRIMDDAKMS